MFVVAIDGPAGVGKSTVAKALAKRLGLAYLDTGAMYRAVTWKAMREGVDLADEVKLREVLDRTCIELTGDGRVLVDGRDVSEEIRTPDVTRNTFYAARAPLVRERMRELQRQMGKAGAVAEGRDMTTVVFPDARAKFYLDAGLDVRVRRRHKQLLESGRDEPIERVRADIRERDQKDLTRKVAPLRRAPDAIYVDTSNMTVDEVVEACAAHVKKRGGAER